jgi:3-hydroxyisobutyrate dehydrogenase-like beta-hydroxyacid dehydrogenase
LWNRSAAKAQPLLDLGARLAATPRQAAADRDLVATMLADDAALQEVCSGADGLMAGLARQGVHVSMSTIAVATAERLKQEHAVHGQRFLSAPVFGRPEAAAAAKLFIVAAGEEADIKAAGPFFAAVGQRVFELGSNPAAANLVKLCGNFMILAAVEAMGEAMTLAEKGGVERARLLEVLTGSLFDVPLYRNYGAMLAQQRFVPAGFAAPLGLKDMRLAAQAADSLRVPMPLLSVLRDHLLQTIAVEGEDIDWSGIGRSIARNAGL